MSSAYGKKNLRRMEALLKERVSPKRFEHSLGVSETAAEIAHIYGMDEDKARFAGLIHDWDKGLSVEELHRRIARYRIDIPGEVADNMPWLLHGPTAAAVLGDDFPEIGRDVLQAVARHTTGALGMSDLDMAVYAADLIEPNRSFDGAGELRCAVGDIPLEELYFRSFKQVLVFLVEGERPLQPQTASIWNDLIERRGGPRSGGVRATFAAPPRQRR